MRKYLLVEDDRLIRRYIVEYFKMQNEKVVEAINGYEALHYIEQEEFDLVLLDIMMPGIDGYEVCQKIRKNKNIPIIFISALSESEYQLKGYDLGADDYIAKPFSASILYAKCNALLKRYHPKQNNTIEMIGEFQIDEAMHQIALNHKLLSLTNKEYSLLLFLLKHQNQVFTREQLLYYIWGNDFYGDERVVDTYIKSLRKKIQDSRSKIITIYGVGYAFQM